MLFYEASFRCHIPQVVLGGLVLGAGRCDRPLIARVRAEVGQGDLWWSHPQPWGRRAKNVLGDEQGVAEPLQSPQGLGLILGLASLNSI